MTTAGEISNATAMTSSLSPVRPMPNGFAKQVSRMRLAKKERDDLEEKSQKRARGEEYDRVKLA